MDKFFKYIKEDKNGFTTYDEYFQYLDSNKTRFCDNLYEFASDVSRYELNTSNTLHDLNLKNIATEKLGCCQLSLCSDDYTIIIKYSVVTNQSLMSTEFVYPSRLQLLCHEFTINAEKSFTHAVEFDRGLYFAITFSEFEYIETRS